MSFLTGVLGVVDANDNVVQPTDYAGTAIPPFIKIGPGLTATATQEGMGYVTLGVSAEIADTAVPAVYLVRNVITSPVDNLGSFYIYDDIGVQIVAEGDVLLLTGQLSPAKNGPYVAGPIGANAVVLTRPMWWASGSTVRPGTLFATPGQLWQSSSTSPTIIVDTHDPVLRPYSSAQIVTSDAPVDLIPASGVVKVHNTSDACTINLPNPVHASGLRTLLRFAAPGSTHNVILKRSGSAIINGVDDDFYFIGSVQDVWLTCDGSDWYLSPCFGNLNDESISITGTLTANTISAGGTSLGWGVLNTGSGSLELRVGSGQHVTIGGLGGSAGIVHATAAGVVTASPIVDADVSSSAAISASKIKPTWTYRSITGTSSGAPAALNTSSAVNFIDNMVSSQWVQLPQPSANAGLRVEFVANASPASHNWTLVRYGSEQIDGVSSNKTIAAATSRNVVLYCDGTQWYTATMPQAT